jgi:putative inorganic carbon (HCO3(-)) transporter
VIVFVLMLNTLTTVRRLEQLTWLIVLCCGYIAGRAVLDYSRGINLVEQGRVTAAIGGLFGGPNDLALNLVAFLPPAAVVVMSRHQSTAKRVTAAIVTALMIAAIVFTKSRGGALGLLAVLVALALLGRKVRKGFGAIVIVAALAASAVMPTSFWTRMGSIVNEDVDRQQFTGSREARRRLMEEGLQTFAERPLTGVGAGQFQNYNPAGRRERWRETHNVLIQVAAETGIFGLLAFSFLIVRAAVSAASALRTLRRPRRPRDGDPARVVMSAGDRRLLSAHAVAMTSALIGWFVCAQFASVAYNWTFYYLLALIVAARELISHRFALARALETEKAEAGSIPSAIASHRMVTGAAYGGR